MEGTLGGEKIAHAADAATPASLSPRQLSRLITTAGWTPVERDGRHRVVEVGTSEPVLGMIPFLNSEPFHWNLHLDSFRVIPMAPRRMGQLAWLLRAHTLVDIDCWTSCPGQPLRPRDIYHNIVAKLEPTEEGVAA